MTLQDALTENIITRKLFKSKVDKVLYDKYNLSQKDLSGRISFGISNVNNSAIGLSEGAIVDYADLSGIRLYLTEGSMKKAFDRLDQSFQYPVNLGHNNTNPLDIIGYFSKSDVELTKTSEGRNALSFRFNLDQENTNVPALKKIADNVSLSAEFYIKDYIWLSVDSKDLGSEEDIWIDVLGVTDLEITGFSIVQNPADVSAFNTYKLSKLMNSNEEVIKTESTEETTAEVVAETVTEAEVESTETTEVEATEESTGTNEIKSTEVVEENIVDKVVEELSALRQRSALDMQTLALKDQEIKLANEKISLLESKNNDIQTKLNKLLQGSEIASRSYTESTNKNQELANRLRI